MTDRYAVFGNPIAHSKSPQIHALFAQQTQQDMGYEAILAPLDGFERSVHDFIAAGGRGANVTVPFKEQAFRLSAQLTTRAKAAGAVNTLIFEGNIITGDNTDGAGLITDIQKNLGFQIAGKRILLLGAGGAVRGALIPLADQEPEQMAIANRSPEKAKNLMDDFFDGFFVGKLLGKVYGRGSFGDLAGESFDLIINATSAGLQNAELPLPDSIFAPGCLAYEMLYGRETPFMRQAKMANATIADGLGMLVEQAAEAFYVWRGVRPDTASVLNTLRNA